MKNDLDLFVCDVDYDVYGTKIEHLLTKEDEVLSKLVSILKKLSKSGLSLGEAHNSIVILSEELKKIYDKSRGQGEKVSSNTLEFLSRIDSVDLKLYGG